MTEQMVYYIATSFGVVGSLWAICFAIYAFCKYVK
jgi:hypothetical protein